MKFIGIWRRIGSIIRRAFALPLLLLNFGICIIIVAIAGWALNLAIDLGWEAVSYNPATFYFVMFTLVAGVVGIAANFSGFHHLKIWSPESLCGSAASATIAWLLALLAMGLAFKEINYGGYRYIRLRVLEAFVIILVITEFLYLLVLGSGVGRHREIIEEAREAKVEIPSIPKDPSTSTS